MSQIAHSIVETDTNALINLANEITMSCTGTNCNVSDTNRTAITRQLSILAQQQSNDVLILLSVPASSIIGRQIYESYLNLGSAVSSAYNYQCGDNVNTSFVCVNNSTSVEIAQKNLEYVLTQPTQNQVNHITVLSILFVIALITSFLFFVFFLIGFSEMIYDIITPEPYIINQIPIQPIVIQSQIPVAIQSPVQSQIPVAIQSQIPVMIQPQRSVQKQVLGDRSKDEQIAKPADMFESKEEDGIRTPNFSNN